MSREKRQIVFEEILKNVEQLLGSEPVTVKDVAERVSIHSSVAKDALCELRRQGKASEFPAGWVQRGSSGARSLVDQWRMAEETLSFKQAIADATLRQYRAGAACFSTEMREACEAYDAIVQRMAERDRLIAQIRPSTAAERKCPKCMRGAALSCWALEDGTAVMRCRWPDCKYERVDERFP